MKTLKSLVSNAFTMILVVALLVGAIFLSGMSDPKNKEISNEQYWELSEMKSSLKFTAYQNEYDGDILKLIDTAMEDEKVTVMELETIYKSAGKLAKKKLVRNFAEEARALKAEADAMILKSELEMRKIVSESTSIELITGK